MEAIVTTLPFKVRDRTIIIIKGVPVWQCARCSEYLLEDAVMAQVDSILAHVNATTELEVIEFAA
jgi:YgiT-type zinc finger domain-containing protein